MDRLEFLQKVHVFGDRGELLAGCRRYLLHGTPYVFDGKEGEYFDFRRKIADKFGIGFYEVFVVGSAKLGFSPHKDKVFDLDSDVDIAMVSSKLFDELMEQIRGYQSELRRSRRAVTDREIGMYHQFLEYVALGWIRPDKIPGSFSLYLVKNDWFEFFRSLSNGKSEIGNYKVSAGVFRNHHCLESYLLSGLQEVYNLVKVKAQL